MLICTAGFLLAAIRPSFNTASAAATRPRVRCTAFCILSLLLLGLAVILAVGPDASSSAWYGQSVLLAASAALFVSGRALRHGQQVNPAQAAPVATVDALTGAASHRAFQDRLTHECDRAYRFGDTFTLLVLDLDDFHPVNNRHGHQIGDRILVELAGRLRSQLREIDLIARFGGDQFAMILPHTFAKGGRDVAERLRRNVAAWVFIASDGTELHLTAGLGLCSYPQNGTSAPELVESAMSALRFAKAMGGNQVQSASDLPGRPAGDNVVQLPHTGRGAIVRSLAAAVDVRDGYTRRHSQMVSELSAATAKRLGLSDTDVGRVGVGGLLHDVGKIGVPDAIFTKTGSLTREEWAQIKQHPVLGKQIIEQAPELADVIPLVLHHQEHFDGSGYPHRLRGDGIPLGARIIAAADAYHAIRSNRPYRPGRTHDEATAEITRCAGTQFDPRIVQALLATLDSDDELRTMVGGDGSGSSQVTAGAIS